MPKDPFTPPVVETGPLSPLYSPTIITLCTVLFTPVVGGAIVATNHWRVGDSTRAWQRALSGVAALVALSLFALVLPDSVRTGASLGATVGTAFAFHRDATALRAKHPDAPLASGLVPVAFGVGFVLFLLVVPVLAWIITGDPALRPDGMGPLPSR